jgi:hypothetical protein
MAYPYNLRVRKIPGMESIFEYSKSNLNLQDTVIPSKECTDSIAKSSQRRDINFDSCADDRKTLLSWADKEDIFMKKIPLLQNKKLYKEVKLFLLRLRYYERIPISKCISISDYFTRCLNEGPPFAEWLKKARQYTFQMSVGICVKDLPEDIYIMEGYEGYDSFLNECYLIHWTEQSEDYLWQYIPENLEKREFQDEFISFCKEYLEKKLSRKEIITMTKLELDNMISGSSSYVPVLGKNIAQRSVFLRTDNLDEECIGNRTLIQVSPANCRDVCVPDISTCRHLHILNNLYMQILDHIPNSCMGNNNQRITALLDNLSENYNLRYHWDIKKCGLSFPKYLCEKINKILCGIFPNKGFELYNRISNATVIIDGTPTKTCRGYKLGWANYMPTLIACLIFRYLKKIHSEMFKNDVGLFFNDDALLLERAPLKLLEGENEHLLGIYTEHKLNCILNIYFKLDIPLSLKKCFVAKNVSQFCENYHRTGVDTSFMTTKHQIIISNLCLAFFAIDISQAKSIVASTGLWGTNEPIIINILNDILLFWGYEYFPEEVSMSENHGGWMSNQSYTGQREVDYSLVRIFDVYTEKQRNFALWYLLENKKEITFNRPIKIEFNEVENFIIKERKIENSIDFPVRRPNIMQIFVENDISLKGIPFWEEMAKSEVDALAYSENWMIYLKRRFMQKKEYDTTHVVNIPEYIQEDAYLQEYNFSDFGIEAVSDQIPQLDMTMSAEDFGIEII